MVTELIVLFGTVVNCDCCQLNSTNIAIRWGVSEQQFNMKSCDDYTEHHEIELSLTDVRFNGKGLYAPIMKKLKSMFRM